MLLIRNVQQHSDFKKYSHAKLLIWRSQKPKSKSWVFLLALDFVHHVNKRYYRYDS